MNTSFLFSFAAFSAFFFLLLFGVSSSCLTHPKPKGIALKYVGRALYSVLLVLAVYTIDDKRRDTMDSRHPRCGVS